MERKARSSLPLSEFVRLSNSSERVVNALVTVGVLTPFHGLEDDGRGQHNEYIASQLWKVKYAMKIRKQHPTWKWEDIAASFLAMDPLAKDQL